MTTRRDIAEQEADSVSLTDMAKAVVEGVVGVEQGWRAPPRHEHDAEDAAEAQADAAVTRAIERGRETMTMGIDFAALERQLLAGVTAVLANLMRHLYEDHVISRALDLGLQHVHNYELADVSGLEKEKMAREALKADLLRDGHEAVDGLVNMAIPIAYNMVLAAAAQATAAAPKP